MLKRTFVVPVVACLLFSHSSGTAQDTEPGKSQVEQGTAKATALESAEADYRELICSTAADFTKRNQESAIRIARDLEYVDERFNEPIRQVLGTAKKPDVWDAQEIGRAEQLMDVCTIEATERMKLAFHCYLQCGDDRSDSNLRRRFQNRLAKLPDETSRLLKERLSRGEYPSQLMDLVRIVGDSSESILPLVMDAARSDDPDLGVRAMYAARDLISRLKALEIEKQKEVSRVSLGVEHLDEETVTYATRIVARYDKNKDQELTESEYDKMLMSPKNADADNNGRITVTEYAAWMQRAKGR